jgi:hypothetical protein
MYNPLIKCELNKFGLSPKASKCARDLKPFTQYNLVGTLNITWYSGRKEDKFVLSLYCRCLHKTGGALPFSPSKCCRIITACCYLHNYAIDRRQPEPEILEDDIEEQIDFNVHHGDNMGNQVRQRLIDSL